MAAGDSRLRGLVWLSRTTARAAPGPLRTGRLRLAAAQTLPGGASPGCVPTLGSHLAAWGSVKRPCRLDGDDECLVAVRGGPQLCRRLYGACLYEAFNKYLERIPARPCRA